MPSFQEGFGRFSLKTKFGPTETQLLGLGELPESVGEAGGLEAPPARGSGHELSKKGEPLGREFVRAGRQGAPYRGRPRDFLD